MQQIVEDLLQIEGVLGGLLVGKDGLVIVSTLQDTDDAEALGALAAAVYGEIDKSAKRIGVGTLVDAIINAQYGSILLLEAKDLLLVAVTMRDAEPGTVKAAMQHAAERSAADVPT